MSGHTKGPWEAEPMTGRGAWVRGASGEWAALACGDSDLTAEANARLIAASPALLEALIELSEVFALDGECSMERFERLAEMFRKDTGYLAPGKDQPMGGAHQPDGADLRRIYDDWFAAKVTRARAAIALATSDTPSPRAQSERSGG